MVIWLSCENFSKLEITLIVFSCLFGGEVVQYGIKEKLEP